MTRWTTSDLCDDADCSRTRGSVITPALFVNQETEEDFAQIQHSQVEEFDYFVRCLR